MGHDGIGHVNDLRDIDFDELVEGFDLVADDLFPMGLTEIRRDDMAIIRDVSRHDQRVTKGVPRES